ncbi:hypothetical protein FRB94_002758 [Tulasnella sp. JGI-2019a]|nr:hypothetical protein FRB94_002758 [Tulasnella sp. JGI-2019a]KAG9012380.1 hypothetical protein FRB93_001803 [Tulasnella sp. JGI-2019a]KAG9031397.1 hypothetical protein FRB95_002761 [Tulasnella sp. JGI-2019a]
MRTIFIAAFTFMATALAIPVLHVVDSAAIPLNKREPTVTDPLGFAQQNIAFMTRAYKEKHKKLRLAKVDEETYKFTDPQRVAEAVDRQKRLEGEIAELERRLAQERVDTDAIMREDRWVDAILRRPR